MAGFTRSSSCRAINSVELYRRAQLLTSKECIQPEALSSLHVGVVIPSNVSQICEDADSSTSDLKDMFSNSQSTSLSQSHKVEKPHNVLEPVKHVHLEDHSDTEMSDCLNAKVLDGTGFPPTEGCLDDDCMPSVPSGFPSFKRIPGTRFIVDGFRQAGPWSRAYFLSHFHSDHYTGLTSNWNKGIIFCSSVTARLLIECMKIPATFVCPLPTREHVYIDSVRVTLVDANHCPGAIQMLFQVPIQGSDKFMKYIHTGDMRYTPQMTADAHLCDFVGADAVFLDTTYCNPKYSFPSQDESINFVAETIYTKMKDNMSKEKDRVLAELQEQHFTAKETDESESEVVYPFCNSVTEDESYLNSHNTDETSSQSKSKNVYHTVFLVSTYVIGKEKILLSIANKCNCQIYVDEKKFSILKCLDIGNLGIFTTNPYSTNVHVVSWNYLGETWPYFRPNFRNMEDVLAKMGCQKVIGFVPTGWTYETKKKGFSVRRKGLLEIHLVPYSEHSNYEELRDYVAFLKPQRIIPTVGHDGIDMNSKSVAAIQKHFSSLVDEMANKRKFVEGFKRSSNIKIDSGDDKQTLLDKAYLQNCNNGMPKVLFGKGAKKRHKDDIDMSQSDSSVKKIAKGVLKTTPELLTAVKRVDRNMSIDKEVEEQLRSVLPRDLSHEQACELLYKANGSLDQAVTLYFEGSTTGEEVDAQGHLAELDVIKTGASSDNQSSADTQLYHKIKSPAPISQKSKTSSKKAIKSKFSPSNKKGKESQASLLNFFKKKDETPKDLTDSENSCRSTLNFSKFPMMLSTTLGEDKDVQQKVDQILSVLGTSLSTQEALDLIKQARGNLEAAIDAYYKRQEHQDSSYILEANTENFNFGQSTCQTEEGFKSKKMDGHTMVKKNEGEIKGTNEILSCKQQYNPVEFKNDFLTLPVSEYKPIEHACWTKDDPAPYTHLARAFDLVEQEKGRLKTSDMLCNMFRTLLALAPDAVLPSVYLATNRIAPDYENVDLNVGGGIVSAAIVEVTGCQRSKIKEMYNSMGDLGDVAQACRQNQSLLVPPRGLSIQHVFSTLQKIGKETGSGSNLRKKNLITGLLRACKEKEIKYIVRTLVQNMRIGAMIRSILPALAQAVVYHKISPDTKSEQLKADLQSASTAIVEAYNLMPNLDMLVSGLLKEGIRSIVNNIAVSPGIPMKPMLAKITNGILDVLKHFSGKAFTCEYKYDGQRAQVHLLKDGSIKVFSRNCEDTTSRFPDVLHIVNMAKRPGIQDFIFDAEIVAVDRKDNNKLLAFQHLSTRERGGVNSSVSIENIKVDVCVFIFDLMYLNGEPLVKLPFRERRKRMHECFQDCQAGYFDFARQIIVEANETYLEDSVKSVKLESFLEESINSSCEGMMVKALDEDSAYAPSKRSDSWLKVKRDYVEGLHDSLDLVPIGAWYGNGRKAGWYSPFLLACYDTNREEFQSVCRVMSGFSDAFYKEMKEFFSGERVVLQKPAYYCTLENPDVWFLPEKVWEIRGADLTISPVHQAAVGLVHPSRGISLRFPRFIKQRFDKKPEDASAPLEIADLFHKQSRKLDVPKSHGSTND